MNEEGKTPAADPIQIFRKQMRSYGVLLAILPFFLYTKRP